MGWHCSITGTLMNKSLPETLYTAEQVRKLDYAAIHNEGIPGFELMGRAARAVMSAISRQWPATQSLLVLCGGGNNAGDGYLLAKLAKEKGLLVEVLTLKAPEQLCGDAHSAWQACVAAKVKIQPFSSRQSLHGDVVVDAILGTGLSGEVRADYAQVITQLNQSGLTICAVDIPSGLDADTGMPLGVAVKASMTVSFIGLKQGLLTGFGPEYCGELVFNSLRVPESVYQAAPSTCRRITSAQFKNWLMPRSPAAHKGDFGHLLLIGGNLGMPGAILMAAESALYCGAGRITVVTHSSHLSALAVRCPEVMGTSVDADLGYLGEGKSAIVIGPGLGRDRWALQMLSEALKLECPLVLDADALNLLAENPQLLKGRKSPMIFTPHPGELARLSGQDITSIQKNRFAALVDSHRQLQQWCEANITLLLKGAGTLIGDGQSIALCSAGNPGMAVAGMGDVLSGVIGALLARGLDGFKVAQLAAWLHASAADDLVLQQGENGLRATELIPVIRQRLNSIIGS